MKEEIEPLPAGCGYQGYEFGASYPDSACFGGKLYDMDACDGNGMIYDPMEDIPCPMCDRQAAIDWWSESRFDGDIDSATKLVDDIINNRKNGTEPWKG
jgi:hypothetical protein